MSAMSKEEEALRQEAKRLKIRNWHNKGVGKLKQEVLKAKALENAGEPQEDLTADGAEDPTKKESLRKAEKFDAAVKSEEERGNRGFKESAKEERLYPFVNERGRIGLYRRIDKELFIPPNKKESSFELVRWQDER